MKYKIGDKVKIKENVLLTLPERADAHLKNQVGMIGKVIKIHEHDGENTARVKPIDSKLKGRFWWNESDLEGIR
ncbi:hypothetical protein [Liquorilactobacillus nagelii]|uniref:hypothetical protein n=1 Tax=Liquorilactobacillus nagelii TaxID=82688 RepID=UPI0039EC932F